MEEEVKVIPPIHDMTIKPEYFYLVKSGSKKFEVRTNDSRRRAMHKDDLIRLVNEDPENPEVLWLKIVDKLEFPTFTELYDSFEDKEPVGFKGRTTESIVNELRRFYTEEKERETGVVAIEVELTDDPFLEKKPITRRLTPIKRTY